MISKPKWMDAGVVGQNGQLPMPVLDWHSYYHDKSIRLGLTAGLRVFVCSNMAFSGDFAPVLAKHTKSFNLIDTLSVGVGRIQRNFELLQRHVELWRKTQITDDTANLIFYSAFIDGKIPGALCPRSTATTSSCGIPSYRQTGRLPRPCAELVQADPVHVYGEMKRVVLLDDARSSHVAPLKAVPR